MKSVGEQAREYRIARGWSVKEMAAACGTSRQNIETLEAKGDRTPRYVARLADVMGTTVDTLLKGRYNVSTTSPSETVHAAAAAPVVRPVASDDLLVALAVVAKAIEKADEMTRLSVEPLLSLLAREPAQSGNISHLLHKLLTVESHTSSAVDDGAPGRRTIGLSTPKSMGQDGQRDSTQRPTGTK